MLKRFMNHTHRDQKGITGLETAIILIAFVVVAAVFAFTALSAGLFSTEKSKEAVYSGINETQSTLELKGNVTANTVQVLNDMDSATVNTDWTAVDSAANGTFSLDRESTLQKEGVYCLKVDTGGLGLNDYIYDGMTAQTISTTDTVSFWVMCETDDTLAADIKIYFDTDTAITNSTATFDVPALTEDIWTYVSDSVAVSKASATYYGFQYTQASDVVFYIDFVECPWLTASRTSMPTSVVDSVDFNVVCALNGEAIDFTLPTDSNSDGVLTSADNSGTKTNRINISYIDAYQQVSDLAWAITRVVGDTDDYLLEDSEIFKVTVYLKAVNGGAGSSGELLSTSHEFTLEVKPPVGAILTINKTTPSVLNTVDDLN